MIFSYNMKSAVVVKDLSERIILARTDTGELLNISVPCRKINPGSLIVFDSDTDGCLIRSVNGKDCKSICRRQTFAIVLENKEGKTLLSPELKPEAGRNVI